MYRKYKFQIFYELANRNSKLLNERDKKTMKFFAAGLFYIFITKHYY
jgi:hypothetical protein